MDRCDSNRLDINAYPPLRVRMSEKIISAETLKFVRRSFESVWALELILMMRRENTRCWSVSELTQQLRASELLVGGILPDLVRKGLVLETRKACSSIVPPQSSSSSW